MRKNTQSILEDSNAMNNLIGSKLPLPTKSVPNLYDLTLTNPQILITLLTTRELQILAFAIDGFTNREIAEFHFIEETIVKRHRQNIMDKVGVVGRKEMRLFMRAVQSMLKNGAKSTMNEGEICNSFVK